MGIQDFTMDFFSLKGKNAIVTGGNTGLGAVICVGAGQGRCQPVCTQHYWMMTVKPKILFEAQGVAYEFMKIDITDEGAPKSIIETCAATFGSIDILVNSAGISIIGSGRKFW